jgi:hypothetical protein
MDYQSPMDRRKGACGKSVNILIIHKNTFNCKIKMFFPSFCGYEHCPGYQQPLHVYAAIVCLAILATFLITGFAFIYGWMI